jgi:hypothetical protein
VIEKSAAPENKHTANGEHTRAQKAPPRREDAEQEQRSSRLPGGTAAMTPKKHTHTNNTVAAQPASRRRHHQRTVGRILLDAGRQAGRTLGGAENWVGAVGRWAIGAAATAIRADLGEIRRASGSAMLAAT